MTDPRFYVSSLVGYLITDANRGGTTRPKTTFYVFDALYNHAVVATFEYRKGAYAQSVTRYREAAERECARLNAWWDAELARG